MIEQLIKDHLLSDANISALVGDRVRDNPAEEDIANPFLTYQLISDVPVFSADGTDSLSNARVQISCWAATRSQCIALRQAVRQSLARNRPTTFHAIRIDGSHTFSAESKQKGVSDDYSIWIQESEE